MGDNRPSAYREDGKSIYRVSSSGMCVTALAAYFMDYEEDRAQWAEMVLMEAAQEGNLHEPDILERLRNDEKMRVTVSQDGGDGQEEMNFEIMKNVILRGHPDGFARLPRGRTDHLVEAKTMSKTRFKKWASYPDVETALLSPDFIKYGWQISGYMHFYEMPVVYAAKNRDSGAMDVQILKKPVIDLKAFKKKLIQVEKWRLKGELPPCGAESSERTFCPFPYLHDSEFGTEDDAPWEPASDTTIDVMMPLCEERERLTAIMQEGKLAEEERRDINRALMSEMPSQEKGTRLEIGPYTVKVAGSTGKKQISHTELYLLLRTAIIENGGGKVPKGALDWLTPDRLKELMEKAKVPGNPYTYILVDKREDSE